MFDSEQECSESLGAISKVDVLPLRHCIMLWLVVDKRLGLGKTFTRQGVQGMKKTSRPSCTALME